MAVAIWLTGESGGSLAFRLRRCNRAYGIALLLALSALSGVAFANQPVVEFVELEMANGSWTAHVTVRHEDVGWKHYADAWRIVTPDNKVLVTRTLYHPHQGEQPFTRTLSGIAIPASVISLKVQAHDKVHGWGDAVRVDLKQSEGPRFRVRRR